MSVSQLESGTRSLGGRLLGLVALVLLIPVIAVIIALTAVVLVVAAAFDAILLAVTGTEFAVRKVLAVPGWIGHNAKWLVTGEGNWRWVP